MNAYGYGRASTADQSLTLEAQHERVEAYCKSQGMTLAKWITDPATSGRSLFAKRKGGSELCEEIRKGEAKAVVIAKLDRAFRNTLDCLKTMQEWHAKGVAVHVLDMGVNTSTNTGQLFLTILAAVAEFERNLIAERTAIAMQNGQSNGKRVSSIPPYGYEIDTDSPLHPKSGLHTRIKPNPKEQAIIQRCGEMRDLGMSKPQIAEELNMQGYRQRNGKMFDQNSVTRALRRL